MNKIVLQIGLLFFSLSLIFFSQLGLSLMDIVVRSFIIFVVVTVMISFLTIIFIRAVNKVTEEKTNLGKNLSSKSS